MAQIMKMGKVKGSKKWSKQVRKENRPYLRSGDQQLAPGPSLPKCSECLLVDSSDEEGGEPEAQPSCSMDLPKSSRPSWTLKGNNVTSDEYGVVPLPAEDKSSVALGVPLGVAASDRPDQAGALPPGITVRTMPGKKQFFVTPMHPSARTHPDLAMAPRVLGNSQRENFLQSPLRGESSSSFLGDIGLLTPPHKDDLSQQHHNHQGDDYFEPIPDEVLLQVLCCLSRRTLAICMRVCRRWYRVGCDESLWRRVDISTRKVRSGTLGLLIKRGITHLRLARAEVKGRIHRQLNYRVFEEPSHSRLQYLDLSMATVKENTLADLLSQCRQLKKVSLEHVDLDDTVLHMLSENPNLETLNLAMCQGITSSGLMPIFAHCPRLTQLNLGWCGMDSVCVSYVCGAVPDGVQYLNISGCRDAISDDDVQRLCLRCHSLVQLDMSDSLRLTGATLGAVQSLRQLETLSLNRCYNIPPEEMGELGVMPKLTSLNLLGMLSRGPLEELRYQLTRVKLNTVFISTIARPTTGQHRTSIWEQRMREELR